MPFDIENRPSDSPVVQSVWRSESGDVTSFMSLASTRLQIVFTRRHGVTTLTLRGPDTKPTLTDCPDEAEFIGIELSLGSFAPWLPATALVDRPLLLAETAGRSFSLNAARWDFPSFDSADDFAGRLVREGLFQHDGIVDLALAHRPHDLSPRHLQRRFLQSTGLTQTTVRQIERARHAATLLRGGATILDTVEQAGYADQSHLTRALKRFTGQTPAQMQRRPIDTSPL